MRCFTVIWLWALLLVLRAALVATPIAASFVLGSALAAGAIEDELGRAVAGLAFAVVLPILFHRWLGHIVRRRGRRPAALLPFMAWSSGLLATALALGFADDAGRALRRHGDWFIGERNGAVARAARAVIGSAAAALERFDPAPEVLAVVPLPPEAPPGAPPSLAIWRHPLGGPHRVLPGNESQRFGAARPQPRPTECELGHCGVDLVAPRGAPVSAVFDGVVEKLERDALRGGNAGIYVVVTHGGGAVRSRYIHLDEIAAGVEVGGVVRSAQMIGRLGATGILRSSPHLHFGLQLGERYVDPEPYLRRWELAGASPASSVAVYGRSTL